MVDLEVDLTLKKVAYVYVLKINYEGESAVIRSKRIDGSH